MAAISQRELKRHRTHGNMAYLPTETLRLGLQHDPRAAQILLVQMKSRIADWARTQSTISVTADAPYRELIEQIDLLGDFDAEVALDFCVARGGRHFDTFWAMDTSHYASTWVYEACMRYDRALLRQLIRYFADGPRERAHWVAVTAFEELMACHTRIHVALGRRRLDFPSLSMAGIQAERELLAHRTVDWYFPRSRRYIKAQHSKQTAAMLVSKVGGHVLPLELLDLVCEDMYGKESIADAPELAKAEHDVWGSWD